MAFGISITGNDGGGNFIVQDTDLNMINYQVIASGTASSIPSSSFPGDARLFINGNVGSSNTNKFILLIELVETHSKQLAFQAALVIIYQI